MSARASRRTRGTAGRRHARPGFTLVEVLMALMILSIGLLALAGLGATSLRTARGGAIQTVASSVAGARFDSLASLPCDRIAAAGVTAPVTGTSKARGVEERWSARRLAENNFNMVLVIDTVTVIGRTQRYAFTSRRACR